MNCYFVAFVPEFCLFLNMFFLNELLEVNQSNDFQIVVKSRNMGLIQKSFIGKEVQCFGFEHLVVQRRVDCEGARKFE